MTDLREKLAETLMGDRAVDNWGNPLPCDYDLADAIIAALPDMVVPLVWDQIDAVTFGATSVLGFTYTVWAIDGFGYVKFPGTPCGERFAGGIEAAKAAAQAHHVATSLSAFGVQGWEA